LFQELPARRMLTRILAMKVFLYSLATSFWAYIICH
jgi:hypothetical protein